VNDVAEPIEPLDVTNRPELLALAQEVSASGRPRLLRRNGETLAMLVPVTTSRRSRKRRKTKADYEAFLSAAGSWSDVDTDELLATIYESRDRSLRPTLDL
jgi:hypothetical protein